MDAGELLRRARGDARLGQRQLAERAGVARTTVVAYETGAQSPTVRQLTRLLAACGLCARVELEPLRAHADVLLDQVVDGAPPEALTGPLRWAAALDEAGVDWALDGASAVAAHGLPLPHEDALVVLEDGVDARRWLRAAWARGWDDAGLLIAPAWDEPLHEAQRLLRRPVYTQFGSLHLRLADAPVRGERRAVGGTTMPVLPLGEVEAAHPWLAEVLRRHRERRAEAA